MSGWRFVCTKVTFVRGYDFSIMIRLVEQGPQNRQENPKAKHLKLAQDEREGLRA